MRTRIKISSAIGSAIGLVLMATAITPAAAAPLPTVVSASSCGGLKGATVTGSTAAFSGVALRSGDTITASVAPAGPGDSIFLSASTGLNLIFGEGAAAGYTFRAPADGYYNLTYSLTSRSAASAPLTWSFAATCSTTTVSPSPAPSTPGTPVKPGKGKGKG